MPLRAGVFHIAGAAGKLNRLLVRTVPEPRRCVIFFPGDISDFAPQVGLPNSYSLEALLWVLCAKFPEDMVVLVKPRIMNEFFACYVNFMLVDSQGNPRNLDKEMGRGIEVDEAMPDAADGAAGGATNDVDTTLEHPRAVEHLRGLLGSLQGELGEPLPSRRVLVGFSKGAAVLSSLLRETADELEFWGETEAVHFVDAGLTVPGSFPVGEEELRALGAVAPPGFVMWLHGTPRQWEDTSRPFIAEETGSFAQRCASAGLRVERRLYGAGVAPSLNLHFDALRCFCAGDGADAGGDQHLGFFEHWAGLGSGP